jgi:hypothetical protein
VHPDLETVSREALERDRSQVKSSHAPILSQSEAVAAVIPDPTNSIQE